jgi:hypothetical protein
MHALLIERGLLARSLGGLGRLYAETGFALLSEACFLDLALMLTLGVNLRVLFFALSALRVFSCADARFFSALDGVLLFLDAVLLDLTELAKREQNRIFALLTLSHEESSARWPGLFTCNTHDLAEQ